MIWGVLLFCGINIGGRGGIWEVFLLCYLSFGAFLCLIEKIKKIRKQSDITKTHPVSTG